MTAKEMFEELGYVHWACNTEALEYRKTLRSDTYNPLRDSRHITTLYIIFKDKEYACTDGYGTALIVNMGVHKAIAKQLEELGWLE